MFLVIYWLLFLSSFFTNLFLRGMYLPALSTILTIVKCVMLKIAGAFLSFFAPLHFKQGVSPPKKCLSTGQVHSTGPLLTANDPPDTNPSILLVLDEGRLLREWNKAMPLLLLPFIWSPPSLYHFKETTPIFIHIWSWHLLKASKVCTWCRLFIRVLWVQWVLGSGYCGY